MKKLFIAILSVLFLQGLSFAKDTLQFDFPNDGWHKVASPDGIKSKMCYVPYNQTSENHTEMLVFSERIMKNQGLSAMVMLHKQLGKDKNNYPDIIPEYVYKDIDNAIVTWCSPMKNTCSVKRAFKGNQGIVFVSYINKAPHYSQNIFGQWSNILAGVKVYKPDNATSPKNLIELE